jgi:regulator of cell morphogenesis and NO signaling
MKLPNSAITVGQCVARYPQTARVFDEMGIDYCCGGARTVEAACIERQIESDFLLTRLEQEITCPSNPDDSAWTDASLADLCDHIEETHHHFLRYELPRLRTLTRDFVQTHAKRDPEVLALLDVMQKLHDTLEPHLSKEERELFPAICQLERSVTMPQHSPGSVRAAITEMKSEHQMIDNLLRRIRNLANCLDAASEATRVVVNS